MSLLGKGVLTFWNGISNDFDDEFLKWHVHEHIIDRVALPGFLRARRYVSIDGSPKFFNFYETASVADLSSDVYLAELNSPSAWTKQVVRYFTDTSRTVSEVALTGGRGEGIAIETLRMSSTLLAAEFIANFENQVFPQLVKAPYVVGAHLLQGQSHLAPTETQETKLRGGGDEVAAWILLVETVKTDAIADLRAGPISDARMIAQGAEQDLWRGAYMLQYALSKPEILEFGKS